MAHIRGQNIVDIPPASNKLPPTPPLGYNGDGTAPPSTATSTSSVTQGTLARQVLLYDQRCLVTGAVSTQLQACRLINTIHTAVSSGGEKLLKNEVMRSLSLSAR